MNSQLYKNHDRILVGIDCIIFGFDGVSLKALCIKRGFEPEVGNWSLMGGFVREGEDVNAAAARVLTDLTGLTDIYMEQIFCYGDVSRDPAGRVISVAYFALIDIAEHNRELSAEYDAKWFSLTEMPDLIFDHKKMVQDAKERLQQKVANHPIGFALLPEKFTLQQLQSLYEAIYETTFDKRNFTKKILSLSILKKLEEKEKESSRKGAFYYVFDEEKYRQLDNEGLKII
ncbi:MAG: NUDIX domain-containing protein [Chitinophagaceae bacterium]